MWQTLEFANVAGELLWLRQRLISANLAIVNLLPFPPFDGFYLVMVG